MADDHRDGKLGEPFGIAQDGQVARTRPPDSFGGLPPQDQGAESDCGGEMGDTRIVADEGLARGEPASQFGQRAALHELEPGGGQVPLQTLEAAALRLPAR